jgi:hypothetical protein
MTSGEGPGGDLLLLAGSPGRARASSCELHFEGHVTCRSGFDRPVGDVVTSFVTCGLGLQRSFNRLTVFQGLRDTRVTSYDKQNISSVLHLVPEYQNVRPPYKFRSEAYRICQCKTTTSTSNIRSLLLPANHRPPYLPPPSCTSPPAYPLPYSSEIKCTYQQAHTIRHSHPGCLCRPDPTHGGLPAQAVGIGEEEAFRGKSGLDESSTLR